MESPDATLRMGKRIPTFDHVFATAILNDTAANGDFQWMMPTAVSYAYVDLKSAHDGILAVLCMTAAGGGTGLTPTQQVHQ